MIRDKYLRILFIPLLGVFLPVIAGIITYSKYSASQIIGANVYFIFISFSIWGVSQWIHSKVRLLYKISVNPFLKISSLCLVSAICGTSVGGIMVMIWYKISKENFAWTNFYKFIALSTLAIIVFTLIYEILYLSKERELDTQIVDQLDRERSRAEMTALRNELDPHFIFNSLTTLSYLIVHDAQKAHSFNERLARVFKYFLINKDRELISLEDELEFIESYFFLLQIRHDNKLQLKTELDGYDERKIMILPCALQILVENAIKHNEFTDEDPLEINIAMNEQFLKVMNNVRPKPYLLNSTGIGLRNLSSRYKLVCNKDIIIENTTGNFIVKLPLIK